MTDHVLPDAKDTAFPVAITSQLLGLHAAGLTKREYIATLALQGMLANSRLDSNKSQQTPIIYAKYAVDMADAYSTNSTRRNDYDI